MNHRQGGPNVQNGGRNRLIDHRRVTAGRLCFAGQPDHSGKQHLSDEHCLSDANGHRGNHCRARSTARPRQHRVPDASGHCGPPTPAPKPPPPALPPQPAAWCTASASYNAQYNDYDIYVHSNQPYRTATATASNGESFSYETDSTGYADIYLYADPGNTVTVTVGAASCSTTAN